MLLFGKRFCQSAGSSFACLRNRVDVVGQRERDHVGLEAVDDGLRLLAGAAVRLRDRDVVAGFGLPIFGEGGVVFGVKLARRIVGDVEQLDFLRARRKWPATRRARILRNVFM